MGATGEESEQRQHSRENRLMRRGARSGREQTGSIPAQRLDFVRVLLAEDLVSPRKLVMPIGQLTDNSRAPEGHRERMRAWVRGIVKDLGRG